jgi:hypothetical protein
MRRRSSVLSGSLALLALLPAYALGCGGGSTNDTGTTTKTTTNTITKPAPTASARDAGPAPSSSAWNSGSPPPAVGSSSASPDGGVSVSGGPCGPALSSQRWAWMSSQPIQPPHMYAGLDFVGPTWAGLPIEAAESVPTNATMTGGGLCQGTALGPEGRCPSGLGVCNATAWGQDNQVVASWDATTHEIDQIALYPGYTGAITTMQYPDHTGAKHSYSIGVGSVVQRDGAPFEIQWSTEEASQLNVQLTDIFNAFMATYGAGAGVVFDTSSCTSDSQCNASGTVSVCECEHVTSSAACVSGATGQCGIRNCADDGNCLAYDDGTQTIFGIRPVNLFISGTAGVGQPELSTPQSIYNFRRRWEPSSNSPFHVSLDANGPVATGVPFGIPPTATTTCTQSVGQTFASYQTNCLAVSGNTAIDTINLDKASNGLTLDREHLLPQVQGAHLGFTSALIQNEPTQVLLGSAQPAPGDMAQFFSLDTTSRGSTPNDYGSPSIVEYRGSALIMIEWARLMLADIARLTGAAAPYALGDARCIGFSNGIPNYELGSGCSGIEGMIIPNGVPFGGVVTEFSGDPLGATLDPASNADVIGIYSSLLQPGALTGAFCIDPGVQSDCFASFDTSIFQKALQQVTRVMGGGVVGKLPVELQDPRYYFRWFAVAYVKYLRAYGAYAAEYPATVNDFPSGTVGSGLGPSDVLAESVDLESFSFDYSVLPDSSGVETYDTFRYVDRQFIGQGAGGSYNWIPWTFEYGIDMASGISYEFTWSRAMERQEVALYSAMLTDKTHTPGQETNVNLTNLFGSALLGGAPTGISGAWPSYACAIGQAGDPAVNCVNINFSTDQYLIANAPLDPSDPSGASPCDNQGQCNGVQVCGGGTSYVSGFVSACGDPCDFATYPLSGCASATQTCAFNQSTGNEACLDMMMDKNGTATATPHPLLWAYPSAWSRSPLASGHAPITLAAAGEQPDLGVATVTIPNFVAGPYTPSPILASNGTCAAGYSVSADGVFCNASVNAGTGTLAPSFTPLVGFTDVQASVGFSIPGPGQSSQWISTGKLDFSGVLGSYVADYLPYADPATTSCAGGAACNAGYTCDSESQKCVATDGTLRIAAVESDGFAGQVFLCVDPTTSDVLHVGIYDSAPGVLDWLAAHPGSGSGVGPLPSAQEACGIDVVLSSADGSIASIVSTEYGVILSCAAGRVTSATLFDPSFVGSL